MEELIVDFPINRKRRSVRFADTSKLYLYKVVYSDDDNEEVRRQDLWCDDSDYAHMKCARKKSVRRVREMASAGVADSYCGDGDDECLIGIEHLLSTKTVSRGHHM